MFSSSSPAPSLPHRGWPILRALFARRVGGSRIAPWALPYFPGRGTSRTLTFSFSSRIDHSAIPQLDKTFFKKATMAWPRAKKQLTIRLDEDVLDWLKRHGKGYQTRINRILRVVMESQPPRTAHR